MQSLPKTVEKITPHITHPDQTGFIKCRHPSTNTCGLLNLVDYPFCKNIETTILSLDAEKAFDRVNWKFLFTPAPAEVLLGLSWSTRCLWPGSLPCLLNVLGAMATQTYYQTVVIYWEHYIIFIQYYSRVFESLMMLKFGQAHYQKNFLLKYLLFFKVESSTLTTMTIVFYDKKN